MNHAKDDYAKTPISSPLACRSTNSSNCESTSGLEESGSLETECGILLVGDGSIKANSLGFGIIEANRTVLICGARSLGRNRWRVEPIRYNCLRSSLRTC